MSTVVAYSLLTEFDINLFKAGKQYQLYEKMGSHIIEVNGQKGIYFAVWAPGAKTVSVVGDFNYWDEKATPLNVRWDDSGIWEGFVPTELLNTRYKYKIHSHNNGVVTEKADPFARFGEKPPCTASIVHDNQEYSWEDQDWMSYRKDKNGLNKPYAVYELHLASWKRGTDPLAFLSFREIAGQLVPYIKEMGFTHVEFMPIMEYPYDPSWGYQITGYFAPTARFGPPEDLKYLIDQLHQNDIGVLLDWVPSHFPSDGHGLGTFDGTCVYEHPDHRKGYHPDWKSLIFNYERNEVRSFLISNALFWLKEFHVDGLRIDAVASMLYLDYSRNHGEWEANEFGGNENLAAIHFLKELNTAIYSHVPDVHTIAEESTSYPKVTLPVHLGGLGFGMKWMMGWMHDSLNYFKKDPIHRKFHHDQLSFGLTYAFTENFMLPLSHDEVVHGKKSLIYKMPGDEWQRFANLRLLYGFMYTHPGTKLLFMGAEFAQTHEWDYKYSLDWHLLQYEPHYKMKDYVRDLNLLYTSEPALYELGFDPTGFIWINHSNFEDSIMSYIRKGYDRENDLLVVCNLTPVIRENYRIGVPEACSVEEIFNSDLDKYYGSHIYNPEKRTSQKIDWDYKPNSLTMTLPPLAILVAKITYTEIQN